jgi:hypothetical protein
MAVMADMLASMVDAVMEEGRTALAPGLQQQEWSLCCTWQQCVCIWTKGSCRSDANFMGETCTVHGYKLWTRHQQAMSYRTRSWSCLPNQSILQKSWQDMPFENRWFTPDKRTYKRPTYWSESSWKLQLHLE